MSTQPRPHASHIPRKRFGQHFLHDQGILRRIVEAIAPQPTDRIIEIGPGEGALTLPLLRAAGHLTAIELDRDLIVSLGERARGIGDLAIISADVLTVDFASLSRPSMASGALGLLRIVGNLPYNISTPILFHCLDHAAAIRDMHFMLQKEVVERMAAPPGSKTYGRLSVMLQLRCTVEPLFRVPPGAFRPPPKVDSAIVRLTPLPAHALPDADAELIDRVVRAAFGQRRKTLGNALRDVATSAQINAAGIDPRSRAEQLAPAAFVALARTIAATRAEPLA
ncbi:MAG TPA: 16S rRNA (adenine(1518)-N(6)/adenine(1519)-N(6))-dimethyltransferase RsmA [Rudaea sp.]|jgi:16S rRNA (adenine1518-N6/adenine1519-N6)-dimethyltransferase